MATAIRNCTNYLSPVSALGKKSLYIGIAITAIGYLGHHFSKRRTTANEIGDVQDRFQTLKNLFLNSENQITAYTYRALMAFGALFSLSAAVRSTPTRAPIDFSPPARHYGDVLVAR
jgi:hypothetical protein